MLELQNDTLGRVVSDQEEEAVVSLETQTGAPYEDPLSLDMEADLPPVNTKRSTIMNKTGFP